MQTERHELITTGLPSTDWTCGSRGLTARIRAKALRISIAAPMIIPVAATIPGSSASVRKQGEERGCDKASPPLHAILPGPHERAAPARKRPREKWHTSTGSSKTHPWPWRWDPDEAVAVLATAHVRFGATSLPKPALSCRRTGSISTGSTVIPNPGASYFENEDGSARQLYFNRGLAFHSASIPANTG